jgi:hypothetical protein
MSDAARRGDVLPAAPDSGAGLPGKHEDVKSVPATAPGKTFADVRNHANRAAVEALAARGIIDGKGDDSFDPDAGMTRAEFTTVATRALGLPDRVSSVFGGEAEEQTFASIASFVFADVSADAWYAEAVGAASAYDIVNGVSASEAGRPAVFNPAGTITRQEAAVMVARAAKLAGLDTALDASTVRDALAQFDDYVTADAWARESLAFCYRAGILDDDALDIRPKDAVKRCEIAEMLYRMLDRANLL